MAGYEEVVQGIQQAVSEGRMPAAEAVADAKQLLCQRVHTAVTGSIGYKNARRHQRGVPQPVFTRDVRAAVHAKREAVDRVTAAVHAAANNPALQAELQVAQEALHSTHAAVKAAVQAARAANKEHQIGAVYECASCHDCKGVWRAL
jgi:hypothetical protein